MSLTHLGCTASSSSLSESISKQHKTNKQHLPIATKTPKQPHPQTTTKQKNPGWLIVLHMEDSSLGLRNEEIQPHVSFMAKGFQKCSMPQTDVSRKQRDVFSTQAKSEQTSKGRRGSSMKHQEELMSDKVLALVP